MTEQPALPGYFGDLSGDAKRGDRGNIEQIDPAELADFKSVSSLSLSGYIPL